MSEDEAKLISSVNNSLSSWCQGDCCLGEDWFLYRIDPARPLTPDSAAISEENSDIAEVAIRGFVVVTQTCDIVRNCQVRPYIEVSPLVEVAPERVLEIQKGRRPQYAYVSGIADKNLVVDLDRVMTMEKSVVASWQHTKGCTTDNEVRNLQTAIARKRLRYAFPDDFNQLVSTLQKRLKGKHEKDSEEGKALRNLREIRIRAEPSWNANSIKLMFFFIPDSIDISQDWSKSLEDWRQLIPSSGRYVEVNGQVVDLDDMTARDYVESDPLDLDHLSQ